MKSLLAGAVLILLAGPAWAQVDTCGMGLSEPPFLSYGVKSNLLMLLDNSGSMLDMAYIDPDLDGFVDADNNGVDDTADRSTQCFDESFMLDRETGLLDTSIIYTGNFELTDANGEVWYKWVEGTQPWQHVAYTAGDIVYYDGTFFQAKTGGTSNGETIYKDQNVEWEQVLRPRWDPNGTYHAESFVFDPDRGIVMYTATGGGPPTPTPTSYLNDPRFTAPNGYQVRTWAPNTYYAPFEYVLGDDLILYQTDEVGGTSNALSTKVTNDTVAWKRADYMGWRAGISYQAGDIATANGMIFRCKNPHTPDPASVADIYEDNFSSYWERLDEGYFEKMASETDALYDCANPVTPAHLSSTDNEFYESNDVCVTINNPGTDPQHVLVFAATGNFLNWAMSSKFDIEKSILTGGKFDSDANRIIGESRGCAGKSFIKQAPISRLNSDSTTTPMQMTLKIRPGGINDRIDSTDDTTRLEIYAITQNGLDFDACQKAIDFFIDPNGVAQVEQNTELCVGFSGTGTVPVEHVVYHKAMQACWYLSKQGDWKGGNDQILVAENCKDIYTGNSESQQEIFPANIGFEESFYVCYGVYNSTIADPANREGYIGRCWTPGDYVADPTDDCQQIKCGYGTGDWDGDGTVDPVPNCTNKKGSGLPCFFDGPDGNTWRCSTDNYLDSCSGTWASGAEKCNDPWTNIYQDNFGDYSGTSCTPTVVQDIGFWEADVALGNDDGTLDGNINTSGTEEYNLGTCADEALRDYCKGLDFPEVIDPSDQASSTEAAWNLPGILVDAAIVGQLGEKPLLTTKGYIYADTPPTGILHETAADLRIGAMAFNDTGAGDECPDRLAETQADPLSPVDIFCPTTSKDGARVITPIKLGSRLTYDANGDGVYDAGLDKQHVHDLVASINKVRATSWTPLAEAVYNAVGYYTQNTEFRLYDTDFQTADDVDVWKSGEDYGQGFYVLDGGEIYQTARGGTSGAGSRAQDSKLEWRKVGTVRGGWGASISYSPNDIVKSNDPADPDYYITYSGGLSELKTDAPILSPLYDNKVVWEPLVDPVARFCQDNNILIITEGASTADIKDSVKDFALANGDNDTSEAIDFDGDGIVDDGKCTNGLKGSTYLDDLTYFARDSKNEYHVYPDIDNRGTYKNDELPLGDYPYTMRPKKNINTYIVVAGSLRSGTTTDECNPEEIMTSAAINGGQDGYIPGEDPVTLKKELLELLNAFRQRASAGSAASVISSARGGEGAIYQAIFWPELIRNNGALPVSRDYAVQWAGDVHGLFLDNRGFMFEDRTGDRKLNRCEDIDGDGYLDPENESLGEDIDGDGHFDDEFEDISPCGNSSCADGHLDVDEDIDDDLKLDTGEDINQNFTLDPGEDRDGDGVLDLTEDLNGNGVFDELLDTDGDGVFDSGVDIDGDGIPDISEDIDGDGNFDNVYEDVDHDGLLDFDEDNPPSPYTSGDGDGRLDTGEDLNHNGKLDEGEDVDGDGVLDLTEDLNGDGIFDAFVDLPQIYGDPALDLPNGDGHLDIDEDLDNDGVLDCGPDYDRRVIIYFDEADNRSKVCYNTSIFYDGACNDHDEIYDVNFLWSAVEWLNAIPDANIADPLSAFSDNRSAHANYISDAQRREIFTWNDLNNDGIVDNATEVVDFDSAALSGLNNAFGPVRMDFDIADTATFEQTIDWLRGLDYNEDSNNNEILDAGEDVYANGVLDIPGKTIRSREIPITDNSTTTMTWRLGDIIHSTPMTVASPSEGYHLIYNDFSYATFLRKYKTRRHVVYYGANDGMLHASNAGFYSGKEKRFCLYPLDANGNCPETDPNPNVPDGLGVMPQDYSDAPPLGAELWAYVPYNLQPHLSCLTEKDYFHKYFVDQRPRIFDVQIFAEETECQTSKSDPACIHPYGWGTILVGGMRFGGTPVNAAEINLNAADNRQFTSSYFIMDITNPEAKPVLLGELTRTTDVDGLGDPVQVDLGYSAVIPTMIIMKDIDDSDWYLVFGSGPHDDYGSVVENGLKGVSDQNAKVSILPLDWLVERPSQINDQLGDRIMTSSSAKESLRIPAAQPASGDPHAGGTFVLPLANAFVSDPITVDFDINPSYKEYKSDVVYFGTVQGDFATTADGSTFWDGSGAVYRLITKNRDGFGRSAFGRGTTETSTTPSQWELKPLIHLDTIDGVTPLHQPITASPSVGTDGKKFWVYFGTGRFLHANDKTDENQQAYYGIKEPSILVKDTLLDGNGNTICGNIQTGYFTWDEVEFTNTSHWPGERGLLDVSNVLVGLSSRIENSALECRDPLTGLVIAGDYSCLPSPINNAGAAYLDRLEDYIGGSNYFMVNNLDQQIDSSCIAYNGLNPPPDDDDMVDGWYREFYPWNNRERNVGQATLLGGLVTYTTYQPFKDVCQAEGSAYLYASYYRTGTAWHRNIFGLPEGLTGSGHVSDKLSLGRGLATTPNLHVGAGEGTGDEGPKAFVQTSTGEIKEIQQENLPINNYRTGRSKWKEYIP